MGGRTSGRWRERIATFGRALSILRAAMAAVWAAKLGRVPLPDAVYEAVVRLGPTFVKLAQVASTRPDFVPAAVAERLAELQERAPVFEFQMARRVVEEDLGCPIERAFSDFPSSPVASASLSQVYFAALPGGEPVAVKVQRPGIRPLVERDVRILRVLAWGVERVWSTARQLGLARSVDEFGRWTLAELDFVLEGKNADRFRDNFAAWQDVVFPRVIWSHSTRRVLTMERLHGLRVHQVRARFGPEGTRRLARRLAELEMKMFISDAFFHADLHPGNVFISEDGRILVLDVGMVGSLTTEQRDRFLAYWIGVTRRRRDTAFRHLVALADRADAPDLVAFRAEYDAALDRFYDRDLTERSLARTYLEIVTSGARHGVRFAPELVIQAKAMVTAEALQLVLAPDFRFSEEVRPIVARELASRATPRSLMDRLWEGLAEWILLGEVPSGPARPWTQASPEERRAEERFRRVAETALADAWADAIDDRLGRRGPGGPADLAGWWRDRPNTQAAIRAGLALLRAGADALARAEEEGSEEGQPPDLAGARVGPALVRVLDQLNRECDRWSQPGHWRDHGHQEAAWLSARTLLRVLTERSSRAVSERARLAETEEETA